MRNRGGARLRRPVLAREAVPGVRRLKISVVHVRRHRLCGFGRRRADEPARRGRLPFGLGGTCWRRPLGHVECPRAANGQVLGPRRRLRYVPLRQHGHRLRHRPIRALRRSPGSRPKRRAPRRRTGLLAPLVGGDDQRRAGDRRPRGRCAGGAAVLAADYDARARARAQVVGRGSAAGQGARLRARSEARRAPGPARRRAQSRRRRVGQLEAFEGDKRRAHR
mmetsp:Transcript_14138/g.47177  ORF Transcript_14138/g.47177 Transcript_14138/m.47177 type:complete len:222 (-) Transcript_14138:836-1501(-)